MSEDMELELEPGMDPVESEAREAEYKEILGIEDENEMSDEGDAEADEGGEEGEEIGKNPHRKKRRKKQAVVTVEDDDHLQEINAGDGLDVETNRQAVDPRREEKNTGRSESGIAFSNGLPLIPPENIRSLQGGYHTERIEDRLGETVESDDIRTHRKPAEEQVQVQAQENQSDRIPEIAYTKERQHFHIRRTEQPEQDLLSRQNPLLQSDQKPALSSGQKQAIQFNHNHPLYSDLHQYRPSIDITAAAYQSGRVLVDETRHTLESSDQNYRTGKQELRRIGDPILEAVALLGVISTASSIRDDLQEIGIAAAKVSGFVDTGEISVSDFTLSRKELRKKLSETGRKTSERTILSGREIKIIVKNAQAVSDLYVLRQELKALESSLPEEMKGFIAGADFFDLRNEKTFESIKLYLKHSKNDVVRNAGVSALRVRDIRRMLRDEKKHGLSAMDKGALRLLLAQKKMREARQKVSVFSHIRMHARMAARKMTEADDNVIAGLSGIQRAAVVSQGVYATMRFGVQAGIFAHRVWTTHGIIGKQVGRAERQAIRTVGDGTRYVLTKTAQGIKAVRAGTANTLATTTIAKMSGEAAKEMAAAVSHSSVVQKFRQAEKSARRVQKAVAARTAKIAFVSSRIRDGTRVALAPFRFVKKAIGKVFSFFFGLYKYLAAAFFGMIVLYVILVILLTGILSIFSVEGNAVMNAILVTDEAYVPDTVVTLQEAFEGEKREALAIATGPPQNPAVFHGSSISRYGAPKADGSWTDGYKIYYRDMDGNIIENGVNNIKDVIVLAYVMMDGDFDTDPAARDALISDVWKLLNPGVTWEETDIYTAEVGDDVFHYSCDASSDYSEMEQMRREGVRFYGSVRSYSSDGCAGDEDDRYCEGHEAEVCYGHKDIKVYITVGFMEDLFADPRYPAGGAYQKYVDAFKDRGGWTEEVQEWANALYAGSWFDLYGIDPAGGAGYSVADIMTPEEIAALTEEYGGLDGTRVAVSEYALEMVGKIPYYWGGKPSSGDYDGNHFYSDVKSDGSQYRRTKRGLDCSGFVAFVYWHVLGHPIGASSTGDFTNGRYRKISAEDLKPGDVGLLRTGYSQGGSVNHIGIFVGRDNSGNAIWVHCTGGSASKVVCGAYNFSVYYSIL